MTPYFVCYAIVAAALLLGMFFNRMRIAAIVSFVPIFILIISRGLVGTDSAVYVQEFDVIYYGGFLASDFEPGFALFVELLGPMFASSFKLLIVLGGLTSLIMLFAGLQLERSPVLFMAIVLPFYMIDMSINGLRFGLAFAIVALGAAGLARGKLNIFVICGVIAASIQVSSIVLTIGLWALLEARIRTFLGVAVGALLTVQFFGERFEEKAIANNDILGIGGLSGIAPLFATFVIVVAVQFSKQSITKSRFPLYAILTMQIISFAVARYYYAGLRLQGVFFFLLYLYVATSVRQAAIELSKERLLAASLVATMMVSSASRLKNFSDDNTGPSPFNPYFLDSEIVT